MKIAYNLQKYRGFAFDRKMFSLMFLIYNNELTKDDRRGTLDPYLIKVAGAPPKRNDAALPD